MTKIIYGTHAPIAIIIKPRKHLRPTHNREMMFHCLTHAHKIGLSILHGAMMVLKSLG